MNSKKSTNRSRQSPILNRAAIVGCNNVTTTNVYSLLMGGAVEELILIGEDNEKLLGELSDLLRSVPLSNPFRIRIGDYTDTAEADIVIIAAGERIAGTKNKFNLLDRNVSIVREIVQKLKTVKFKGIVLMLTNPVDILTHVAHEESGFPANKVLGSGTVLNTERLQAIFGSEIGFDSYQFHSYVTGNQDNVEAATWCAARGGSMPLVDFCDPNCPGFPSMLEQIRTAAPSPVSQETFIPVAVGSCVSRICEAILRDEQVILPVSAMTSGEYGIEGVYLSLPCVVGRRGVERIVELPLNAAEQKNLRETGDLLEKISGALKSGTACTATVK